MPIVIPKNLPANDIMKNENIFVMNKKRAESQDIRILEILILNLMPTKIETETQLIRLLSNTPLQINITLLKTNSYKPKNTTKKHLSDFYKTFDQIKDHFYDGLIITGAPVETIDFEKVLYWEELKEIMEYSKKNITSTLHICWGAQAGLYYHYGIDKYEVEEKIFGVFSHINKNLNSPLLRGFDDEFNCPHSRYTINRREDINKIKNLEILAESNKEINEAGVLLVASKDLKQVFISGHLEYSKDTLKKEYIRDCKLGKNNIPKNYFFEDDSNQKIIHNWRSHGHLLFSNWINYCIYQRTPYILK